MMTRHCPNQTLQPVRQCCIIVAWKFRSKIHVSNWIGWLIPKAGLISMLVCLLLMTSCATSDSVARSEGEGTWRIFDCPYETVWSAAVGAAQLDDLCLLDSNQSAGYISAKRVMGVTTFGERVSIWVRPVNPVQTSVEVVSRRVGPPVFVSRNWEEPILKNIATMVDE
jgi:hypothetical protein